MRSSRHIVRMVAVHNEADVLQRNLDWYVEAGFPTVVLDHESTDETPAICREALASGAIAALARTETGGFDRRAVFSRLLELARAQHPDYVLLTAADEFFEVADGGDLRTAMEEDFAAGYTVLSFSNMEFAMTRRDDRNDPDPVTRMRYYRHKRTRMYRAYPCADGLDISSRLGHAPLLPDGIPEKVSPRTYVSRHYPLRSPAQAAYKIERIGFDPALDAGHQYLHLTGKRRQLFSDPETLARYDDDHRWDFEERLPPALLQQTAKALRRAVIALEASERKREALQRERDGLLDDCRRLRGQLDEGAGAGRPER